MKAKGTSPTPTRHCFARICCLDLNYDGSLAHAAFSLAEISLVTGKMQEAPHVKITLPRMKAVRFCEIGQEIKESLKIPIWKVR
jgi:hypothetical protein